MILVDTVKAPLPPGSMRLYDEGRPARTGCGRPGQPARSGREGDAAARWSSRGAAPRDVALVGVVPEVTHDGARAERRGARPPSRAAVVRASPRRSNASATAGHVAPRPSRSPRTPGGQRSSHRPGILPHRRAAGNPARAARNAQQIRTRSAWTRRLRCCLGIMAITPRRARGAPDRDPRHGAGRRLPAVGLPARARRPASPAACATTRRASTIEAFGDCAALEQLRRRGCTPSRRRPRGSARSSRSPIPPELDRRLRDRPERDAGATARLDSAGSRDLRRVRARDLRSREPPLPLSLHQLHELRSALHDRDRRPLRPRGDDDGAVRDVRGVPARVRRPGDRRFHAQPNACPVCGPRLAPARRRRRSRSHVDDPVAAAARGAARRADRRDQGPRRVSPRVRRDLARTRSARLRERKHRDEKPFAVMVRDLAAAEALADPRRRASARLLTSVERPIVLVPQRVRDARSRRTSRRATAMVGLFLPYTPLHHLLLADVGRPLVMTSGNLSDEPIAYRQRRGARAAAATSPTCSSLHDREIETRCDDSVAAVIARTRRRPAPLARLRAARRSRCAARCARPVLACGALLKNTFCLAAGDSAWLGPHIGDLENLETYDAYRDGDRRGSSASCRSGRRSSRTTCIPTTCRRSTRSSAPAGDHVAGAAPSRARRERDGRARPRRPGDRHRLRRHRLRHRRHELGRRDPRRRRRVVRARGDVPADAARRRRSRDPRAVAHRARAGDRRVRRRPAARGARRCSTACRPTRRRAGARCCSRAAAGAARARRRPLLRRLRRAVPRPAHARASKGRSRSSGIRRPTPTSRDAYPLRHRRRRRRRASSICGRRSAARSPISRAAQPVPAIAARVPQHARRRRRRRSCARGRARVRARCRSWRPAAASRTRGSPRACARRWRRSSTCGCTRACRPATAASRSARRSSPTR